jgi:hypothetical protein
MSNVRLCPTTFFLLGAISILTGCASVSGDQKVHINAATAQKQVDFRLNDMRAAEERVYSNDRNLILLGDGNFEIPIDQLISEHLQNKLGAILDGKQISLVYFRVRLYFPNKDAGPPPGVPLLIGLLGSALGAPRLDSPNHVNVSLRGVFKQTEFSGSKSISFMVGSGEAEVKEAFEAAISEAAINLKTLLVAENNS